MDDYGVSPLSMMRMLGPMMMITPLLVLLLTGPFILYPIGRWRSGTTDNQLGMKFVLEYFRMLAFQVGLFGTLIILFMLFANMRPSEKEDGYRIGFGLLIPAAMLFATGGWLLAKSNQHQFWIPRRLFAGYNLVVTGLAGTTAFFLVFQALFTKGSSGDMGRFAGAAVLTYGIAAIACGMRFAKLIGQDSMPIAHDAPPPPSVPVPAPQTGLPSLGGGAFPPL